MRPKPPRKKRDPDSEGSYAYRERKARKAWIGKSVRLVRNVSMKSGAVNKKGTLWRVAGLSRGGGYEIQRITETGECMKFTDDEQKSKGTHWISDANRFDFSEAPEISPEKAK